MRSPAATTSAALWLGEWLWARQPADDVLGALADLDPDAAPVALGDDGSQEPLVGLLARIRPADAAWLLLPRPGSTIGWPRCVPGAPEPAVLVSSGDEALALIRLPGEGWRVDAVRGASVLPLRALALTQRSLSRAFTGLVTEAAGRLAELGLDRPAPRRPGRVWVAAFATLPPTLDPALSALLHRIAGVLDALDLAAADDGAAVTAAEASDRITALTRLRVDLHDLLVAAVAGCAVA